MKKKILLCFSAGGHFTQMQQLINHLPAESFKIISENAPDVTEYKARNSLDALILPKMVSNRLVFLLRTLAYLPSIVRYVLTCNVMVSTGGITSVVPGLLCFTFGRKIIFVETVAKQKELTITGKIFYLIADRFFVQSKVLNQHYDKAIFAGTMYKL